jgi:RNA polymerase sigma-70 factor (ECF subfamily)
VKESAATSEPAAASDGELVERLRRGEELAFRELLSAHDTMLRRLARRFVRTGASADEVVQDTWTAVIEGIGRFEGRSSLKTWITRILLNKARSSAVRDARSIPFSDALRENEPDGPSVDPSRFDRRGRWQEPPARWEVDTPEELLGRQEMGALLARALDELPERQRLILVLRDVEGWTSQELRALVEAGLERP